MPWNFQPVHFRLRIDDEEIEAEMSVPAEQVSAKDLLPVLRQLADGLVQIGVSRAAEAGRNVSCGPGCGACCRQMVPISEVEAQAITEFVASLPESRRTVIEERFRTGLAVLRAAGVELEPEAVAAQTREAKAANGLRYFAARVRCPFLEDESCSIHPVRPISCREYLVSNDPRHCAQPNPDVIAMIPMPAKLSHAMYRTSEPLRVVPLILALEWAAAHPRSPRRPGPEMLQTILGNIGR